MRAWLGVSVEGICCCRVDSMSVCERRWNRENGERDRSRTGVGSEQGLEDGIIRLGHDPVVDLELGLDDHTKLGKNLLPDLLLVLKNLHREKREDDSVSLLIAPIRRSARPPTSS